MLSTLNTVSKIGFSFLSPFLKRYYSYTIMAVIKIIKNVVLRINPSGYSI